MSRYESLFCAARGIGLVIRDQTNARIHLLAGAVILALMLLFEINRSDAALLLLLVIVVWSAEVFNTAIELLCDLISREEHPQIRDIKDISAGAVLLVAIGAGLIGTFVLFPYFTQRMFS